MLRVLDLFSGIGAFSLGLERTGGFKAVAFCEIDPFCRKVLRKHWSDVPIYEDVRELTEGQLSRDGIAVDVICGGFPCQDISRAGNGGGLASERSGLWSEFRRLIGELRPEFALVENVAALLDRDMGTILGDLAGLGFDAEWSTVSACSVGAPHVRQRVFIVAYPNGLNGQEGLRDTDARPYRPLQTINGFAGAGARQRARLAHPSSFYGGADGLAHRMDRNRAIGNSIDCRVSELLGHLVLKAA
jgi:DNA (cytosine-5)-methyltransferase 1